VQSGKQWAKPTDTQKPKQKTKGRIMTHTILTHNGTWTLKSPKTGDHRTFKVSTVQKGNLKDKRVISLLIGQDNETDYLGFGFVREDGTVAVWNKHRGTQFDKFADLFDRETYWRNRGVEFMAETVCRKCNRKLTDPVSIETGIGPICAGR
jgi:hypothetical protein